MLGSCANVDRTSIRNAPPPPPPHYHALRVPFRPPLPSPRLTLTPPIHTHRPPLTYSKFACSEVQAEATKVLFCRSVASIAECQASTLPCVRTSMHQPMLCAKPGGRGFVTQHH